MGSPEPRTKAQVLAADPNWQRLQAHPMGKWLRHTDQCPSRQMLPDLSAIDGPCTCGLNATLAEAAVPGVSGEADPMSDRAVSSEESDR